MEKTNLEQKIELEESEVEVDNQQKFYGIKVDQLAR